MMEFSRLIIQLKIISPCFIPYVEIFPTMGQVSIPSISWEVLERLIYPLVLKVQMFWEGHKNLAHLPLFFWHYIVMSNDKWKMGQNCVAFLEYLNFTNLENQCLQLSFAQLLPSTKQSFCKILFLPLWLLHK